MVKLGNVLFTSIYLVVFQPKESFSRCGCKALTECYQTVMREVLSDDEVLCVEDAASGTSTYSVLLKLIEKYCDEVFHIKIHSKTFEERNLYEVEIYEGDSEKPTILLDAGQDGGAAGVDFAMYVIQQLVACEENRKMLSRVKWVVLPSTNPDGLVLSRLYRSNWQKNGRTWDENSGRGVDITRNFDEEWESCEPKGSHHSVTYAGTEPVSEKETAFIRDTLQNHKDNLKAYVSFRQNGHSILYPFSYSETECPHNEVMATVAGSVAAKVNQKAGLIQRFVNQSIFQQNGKGHCGHSVDYACRTLDVPLTFEMRIFLNAGILSKFHKLPKGYESSLRSGYFEGIKQLYEEVVKMLEPQKADSSEDESGDSDKSSD